MQPRKQEPFVDSASLRRFLLHKQRQAETTVPRRRLQATVRITKLSNGIKFSLVVQVPSGVLSLRESIRVGARRALSMTLVQCA